MKECAFCKNVIEDENYKPFSDGEYICNNCFDSFSECLEYDKKETEINNLKNLIIDESIDKVIEFMKQKVTLESLDDESVNNAMKELTKNENVQEYNKIILDIKNKYDIFNMINIDDISFMSEEFATKMDEKMKKIANEVLEDERFSLIHKDLLSTIPADKESIDLMFSNEEESMIEISLLPFVLICSFIWMVHPLATSEQIVISVLKWGCCSYLKEKFMDNKHYYEKLILMLEQKGKSME